MRWPVFRIAESLPAVLPSGAPEHGPDPGRELVGRERLDYVVVEPSLEALYYVALALPSGQHDNGQGGEVRVGALAQRPDELETVYPRHQAVGYEEVGNAAVAQQVQRLLAILNLGNLVAEPGEFGRHYPSHDPVVVGHQYFQALHVQTFAPSIARVLHVPAVGTIIT